MNPPLCEPLKFGLRSLPNSIGHYPELGQSFHLWGSTVLSVLWLSTSYAITAVRTYYLHTEYHRDQSVLRSLATIFNIIKIKMTLSIARRMDMVHTVYIYVQVLYST
jgi:Ca2+/Na+ antiporter